MKLKRILRIVLVSTFVGSSCFASEEPAPTCQQELEHCVNQCATVIEACDMLQKTLNYEISTRDYIIDGYKRENQNLDVKLKEAKTWYKQPEFVGPLAFFLGVTLTALINKKN